MELMQLFSGKSETPESENEYSYLYEEEDKRTCKLKKKSFLLQNLYD